MVPNPKSVREGCNISPGLFNLCSEYNTKRAGVGVMEAGI